MKYESAVEKAEKIDYREILAEEASTKLTAWLMRLIAPLIKKIVLKVLGKIFQG